MDKRIYLSSPHMGGDELEYIKGAFESNWISPVGPDIKAFEQSIIDYTGVCYCAALSSGTAAIHLALIILGVKKDDEVICQSFTFSGSANPIMYQGATPVFVDSEEETWNMDPELLDHAIQDRIKKGKKPKAIILVHLYGMPAKIMEIKKIAEHYEIPIIEDAAEALGSSIDGQKLGSFGDIGVFSFNGNKIITTSGGGALVSNNSDYVEKAIFLSTQAREKTPHYEHKEVGFNYRLSNISAAIGRGQMEVLDSHVKRRREIYEVYKSELGKWFVFLNEPENYYSNRWLTTTITESLETREKISTELEKQNIESRPLWKPMHMQPVFDGYPVYNHKVSSKLFEKGICLPSGSNMNKSELQKVVLNVKNCLE